MNTGQTILTIGAMLLLSVLVMRVNTSILYSGESVSSAKFGVYLISYGQSRLDEIKSKSFDDTTAANYIPATTSFLTPANKLGAENGEFYGGNPGFNDIDDYSTNPLVWRKDSIKVDPNLGWKGDTNKVPISWACSVVYVSSINPDLVSATQTWNKKITVYVMNKALGDTIKLSTVVSYFSFQ